MNKQYVRMVLVLVGMIGIQLFGMQEPEEPSMHNYIVYNNTPDAVINVGGTVVEPNNKGVQIQADSNEVEVRRANVWMYRFTTDPGRYAISLVKLGRIDPLDPYAERYRIGMANLVESSAREQEITIRIDPALGELVRATYPKRRMALESGGNDPLELTQRNLPYDAKEARIYVRKMVQSNKFSIDELLPLIAFAKKLDLSWAPKPIHSTSNTVIDRMNALKEIETQFPIDAVAAAKQAYQALETSHIDTIIGSSNRMKYREKTNNWVTCSNTKNVPIDGKYYYGLGWGKNIQLQTANAYRPILQERRCRININPGDLEFYERIPDWMTTAVVAYYDRSGNCANRALLTLYYLIKNSFSTQTETVLVNGKPIEKQLVKSMRDAIKRVELIEFTDMDHAFLVINRAEGSNIANPKTWGENAFIADPWLWDKPDLRLYSASKIAERLPQVRELLQEEVLASRYYPLMSTDLLDWWNANESTPLPLPKAPSVEIDNLPLKSAYNEYIHDYQMKDENGDYVFILPDLSKFTIADCVRPKKAPFNAVLKAIRAKE